MANEVQRLVTSNPNARGLVVIVTNDYKDSSDKQLRKKPLPACHLDGEEMRETFEKPELNFALLPTKKNRPASEIKSLIAQVAKCEFPSSYKYFIFVYSGHGGDNCVVANDRGRVDIQRDIIDPLEPGNTSPANGKIVKLFFFNSCRGGLKMEAPETLDAGIERGNYIIAYATMKQYVAYESKSGSKWMVPLAKQLREKKESSVQYILTDMIEQVRSNSNFDCYQNPQFDTTCGHVYLYPGVGRCSCGIGGASATVPPTTQPQSLTPTEPAARVRGDKNIIATGKNKGINVAEVQGHIVTGGNLTVQYYGQLPNQLTGGASPVVPPTTSQSQTLVPLTADEVMDQLGTVEFPLHLWRRLANGLKLGGQTSKFNEGTDNNDKLQRLITHWIDNEEHSWQQLVKAMVKCEQKIKARQLARNVGAPPE